MKYYNGMLGEFQYDENEYEIRTHIAGKEYIKYIGRGTKPIQPLGCVDFSWTFSGSNLLELDLTDWDMSRVIDTSYMFINCKSLEVIIGIENWNTSSLKDSNHMFYNCNKLKCLNLINWDLQNNINMKYMFAYCKSLQFLDLINCNLIHQRIKQIPFVMYRCDKMFEHRRYKRCY